jgi:hypothetical protein
MHDRGQVSSGSVVDILETRDAVWVRVAAVRPEDDWLQVLLEVVSGQVPPGWAPQHWQYEDVLFIGSEHKGREVAEWLAKGCIPIDGSDVQLPALPDSIQWERRASASLYRFEALPWAHDMYTLAPSLAKGSSGPLISPVAPSFVTFAHAAASFFGLELSPGSSFDHIPPTFRDQDRSGRIASVRYDVTGLVVELQGDSLGDCIVELAHEGGSECQELSEFSHQRAEFDLAGGGLPPGAWVVLKRGHSWVDRKFLNWPLTATPDPGVEMVPESRSQLEALVLSGEGPLVEFKVQLPRDREGRYKVARTVAAFANGQGGTIIFGVENEHGALVGLAAEEVTQAVQDSITNSVRSLVTPLPSYTLTRSEVEGDRDRVVLLLEVEAGESPPYGVDPANPRYYVRRGATTFPASSDQVRALARSRPSADSTASPFGGWLR